MPPSEQDREKAILGAINGGLILLDSNERVTCWNAWMESASGLSEAEVSGKTLAEIFPGADLKRLPSAITAALASSASTLITNALNPHLLPLHNRSNRPLLHDITVSPIGSQPVTACMIFVTDVTMATNRERYLRQQQNARYDAVVESAPDVIITHRSRRTSSNSRIRLPSRTWAIPAAELIGREAAELFETKHEFVATWRSAIASPLSTRPRELIAHRKDGSLTYLEASASQWKTGIALLRHRSSCATSTSGEPLTQRCARAKVKLARPRRL